MNPPTIENSLPLSSKRVIGPIPPRDRDGKFRLKPYLGDRIKTNALGEPVRDKDNQPIVERADLRESWEYKVYEPGHERHIDQDAIKGLRLFRVDYDVEPIALVYARNADEARDVYKKEFGIIRFGDSDPKVSPAE